MNGVPHGRGIHRPGSHGPPDGRAHPWNPAAPFDLLSTSYAASRILEVKGPKFVNHDHAAAGPAKFLIKDLKAVIEEAEVSGLRLVTVDALLGAYTALTEAGLGDEDASVVQQWIEDSSARA